MFDPQAAKARCKAALDAPWESQPRQELAAAGNFFTRWDIVTHQKRLVVKGVYGEADADFIAHARSDLPAALEALEEAQGKLEAVEAEGVRLLNVNTPEGGLDYNAGMNKAAECMLIALRAGSSEEGD